ncbi:hypothetical protein [Muriicola marianensis]|uniref:SoxR reducing system RseC family protein n=1 Tax=Muriicola marianensis TaxID=1324801 RepID=A0ABQ1R298_9FLAO|nr:hypothetical protein [Muriicola marianensis]GGD53620.1 hypothetical protein GCM10011361_20400 [Muriicola marianensis]
MSTKSESYLVEENMNTVYDLIRAEMDKTLFKKKYNLSGDIAENGGIDLSPKLVFAYFQPNLGPVAKINLSATNICTDGKRCRLDLKRINGLTYKIHVGFVIGLCSLIIIIAGFYAIMGSGEFDLKILALPLFGLFYFLMIEGVADITTSNTKQRVLKILTDKKVKYKKQ